MECTGSEKEKKNKKRRVSRKRKEMKGQEGSTKTRNATVVRAT